MMSAYVPVLKYVPCINQCKQIKGGRWCSLRYANLYLQGICRFSYEWGLNLSIQIIIQKLAIFFKFTSSTTIKKHNKIHLHNRLPQRMGFGHWLDIWVLRQYPCYSSERRWLLKSGCLRRRQNCHKHTVACLSKLWNNIINERLNHSNIEIQCVVL